MEQEDYALSPSDKEIEKVSNSIKDIDKLATKAPQQVKSAQEDFIEKKLDRRRIAESQKSTGSGLSFSPTRLPCTHK